MISIYDLIYDLTIHEKYLNYLYHQVTVLMVGKPMWNILGVGRSIGALMHRDTKFNNIRIDICDHLTTILTMLVSKIIRTQQVKPV